MVKVSFDVSNSDPADAVAGGGEQAPSGLHLAKIAKLTPGHKKGADGKPDKSSPRLEVEVQILKKNGKPDKYAILYDYISFSEASEWKLDQFLQCFGIASPKKRKGTFDTAKIVGQKCTIRVKDDTYEGERKARLAAYIALDGDAEEADEEDEDDEFEEDELDEDELDDEEEDDEEEEEDEDDADDEEGEYTEEGLQEMSLAQLKTIAEDLEISPMPRGKAKLVAGILDAQGAEEEDEAEELEPEYTMEDLEDMSAAELKEIFEEHDIDLPARKTKKALIEALVPTGLVETDDESEPF